MVDFALSRGALRHLGGRRRPGGGCCCRGLAGFVAYQLTAPTVLAKWPGWEGFWRDAQDLLGISPTNGFSASIVALAGRRGAHPAGPRAAYGPRMSVFTDAERDYLSSATLGRIATVGPDGQPHVVPVTFAFNAAEDADRRRRDRLRQHQEVAGRAGATRG